MLEFNKIYRSCGIIKACLIDPLSLLINKILRLEENDINAVGYYYEEKYQDKNKCKVILYNIYDNELVSWMKTSYTMDLLIVSPYVNKIIFYPIKNINKILYHLIKCRRHRNILEHGTLLNPRARELRKNGTPAENQLWSLIRNRRLNGHKFNRQYII